MFWVISVFLFLLAAFFVIVPLWLRTQHSAELSLELKTWCYPFAGCVAYRGYFARADAASFANGLREQGVQRGDRVIIYMPLGPEGLFTMQACVRLGAIHSVVYAGMGAESLKHRIEDSGAKVVICSDVTYRRGK